MTDHDSSKPDWWDENEELRQDYELPGFEPPSFQDNSFVHEITEELEERYDCSIRFVNRNPAEDGDWVVLLDGTEVLRTDRYRNEDANSVFELSAKEFRAAVEAHVE